MTYRPKIILIFYHLDFITLFFEYFCIEKLVFMIENSNADLQLITTSPDYLVPQYICWSTIMIHKRTPLLLVLTTRNTGLSYLETPVK